MIKNQKWQIEQFQKTYIDQYQRQSLFSYKFPNKEVFAFNYCKSKTKLAAQRNKLWEKMMLKKRAAICTNGWKRKWRLILLRKELLMHSLPAGQKHDSLAWFFGNKIYIWGKIKICIYLICCKLLKVKWKRLKGVQSSNSSFHLSVKMSSCLRLPALFFSSARKT